MTPPPRHPHTDDSIRAFDTVYTTNSIQLLKLALPLFCEQVRPLLAAIVKAQELSYCYRLMMHTGMHEFSVFPEQLDAFVREAEPFCSPQQLALFRTLEQMKKAMDILDKMQILNQEMPFHEATDLSQLLLFMPQLFGQEAQPGDPQKKDPGGECSTRRDTDSNDSTEECAAGRDTGGSDSGGKDIGRKDSGGKASDGHTENTPPPLPSMLTEALTPHQKELFAGYMQRFSDN